MTSDVPAQKHKALKKVGLALLIFALLYLTFVVALSLLVNAEKMSTVAAFSESPWLIVVRLMVYAVLWIFWGPILRRFKPTLTDAAVKATRRPLLILILAYEFLFASEVPQLLMAW